MKIFIFCSIIIILVFAGCSINENKKEKEKEEIPATESLKVGDKAPDFTLKSQNHDDITLSNILTKSIVVLYFYPKDETLICTNQACAFRDSYEDFKQAGAEVIGISSDTVESHKNFEKNHKLPFILLSDPGAKVRKQYGVKTTGIPGRVTFVIDKNGIIQFIFESQMKYKAHVERALNIIKQLNEKKEK